MNKRLILSVIGLGFAFSCNTDQLDKVNPNSLTPGIYYSTTAELTAAVNAVYAQAQSTSLVGREWFFTHDLRSDEMTLGGAQLELPRLQLLRGTHDAANLLVTSVWRGWYRVIHRANLVIQKSADAKSVPQADRDRIVGEAKFMRAWAYFELSTLYGAVPLYKEFVVALDGALPRASVKEVQDFVVADLKAAETALPASHNAANLGRATKGAAQTLLARLYLQQGDYAAAKTELQKVVNSGLYRLTDNYLDLTNEEGEFNSESIFEIVYAPSGGTYNWGADGDGTANAEESVRTQEYSAVGWRNVIPSDKLLNNYERPSKGDAKLDPRYAMSFWSEGDRFNNGNSVMGVAGGTKSTVDGKEQTVSWRKYSVLYKVNSANVLSGINMRIMRYADVLLMLAECENELGNTAAAITLMNQVRARASVAMPPYPTKNYPCGNKAQVFDALVHERFVELSAEQVRNLDLLRWRKHKKQTTEPLSYFAAGRHELLPIPLQEIDNNPAIDQKDQNPGY
jgi:starch-binding outer membrane protein, SusD/RagB family